MGIHALSFFPTEMGVGRCMENAGEWLLRHQQSNGSWYNLGDPKYPYQVHTTVFALDAIELSHQQDTSHPRVTFTLDRNIQYPADTKTQMRTVGKVKIDYTSQVVVYKGQEIRIRGSFNWDLLVKLLEARGSIVTLEEIRKLTDNVNVRIGELKRSLRSSGGAVLADAITNQRIVGYYMDLE
jgi:hypothetical protein